MPVLRESSLTRITLQGATSSSIASGSWLVAATGLDNRSGGNGSQCFWMTFELLCGFNSTPAIYAPIELYLIPAMDGTNAAAVAANSGQMSHLRGVFSVELAQTTPQRLTLEMIPIMPLSYACYIRNTTGQAISGGWILTAQPVIQQF